MPPKFSTKARERLWDKCRGVAPHPTCNLCGLPVTPGQDWDESHVGAPKALGGTETGVGHRRCNQLDNNKNVTPMVAKAKAIRRKHIGAFQSRQKMPCGRNSRQKKTFGGQVIQRLTLSQKMEQMGLIKR